MGSEPGAAALPQQIEDSFQRQLAPLPTDTRQLLLIAAAEPLGDPVLVWRAAERLGIGVEAAAPAVEAGLLEIGAHVAVPASAGAVCDLPGGDPRRNGAACTARWRRSPIPRPIPIAAPGTPPRPHPRPDEDVAADLERSADRARARGGPAAAAAFLERAAELTRDPARRAERALAAAQASIEAGAPDAALRLLSLAEAAPLDELQRAHVDLLRAQIAFAVNRGRDAAPLLLDAAKQLEPLDVAAGS